MADRARFMARCFFHQSSARVVVILISLRHVAENSDRETARVDWLGAILAALGLGALVYGLIESSKSVLRIAQ
jgi:hypothetical protein